MRADVINKTYVVLHEVTDRPPFGFRDNAMLFMLHSSYPSMKPIRTSLGAILLVVGVNFESDYILVSSLHAAF